MAEIKSESAQLEEAEEPKKKNTAERLEEIKEPIVKKEALPWEMQGKNEEESFFAKYTEGAELGKETKQYIEWTLAQESDEKRAEFAKKWFNEHTDQLEGEGVATGVSDDKKIAIAIEKGAFKELREKYKENDIEIENLQALKLDLRKRIIPIESHFLLLNVLEKRADKIKEEVSGLEDETELHIREIELEKLFKVRKELVEKSSGIDLGKEGEKEAETQFGKEEDYIKNNLSGKQEEIRDRTRKEIIEGVWAILPQAEKLKKYGNDPQKFAGDMVREEILKKIQELPSGDAFYELLKNYKPQEIKKAGIFRKRIEIPMEKNGKSLRLSLKPDDFQRFVQNAESVSQKEIGEKAEAELKKQWSEGRERAIREKIERRIQEFSLTPEKAEREVQGVYERIKDRLLTEYLDDLDKKEKSPEEAKRIEKKFEKKGEASDPIKVISEVLLREGRFKNTTGNLKKDIPSLVSFLKDCGEKTTAKKIIEGIDEEQYRKAVEKGKGSWELLSLLFELLQKLIRSVKKPASKK